MAEIFLARGVGTAGVERYVVLKRIIRDKATDTMFVQMFLEEAKLAAHLQHANIAQVYDIGRLGDSYFFTMEYVHGETVRALLQRARSLRREIPLGIVLTVIVGTAAGLQHAHDRIGIDGRPLGIVHRDVSPSNLMISYDGSVKVVDFGVAKAQNRAQETRSGAVKGKISYLSPEQCRGAVLDRRSDLFSLGIVLWELLTTERLYRRNSDFENMSAIVNEPTPSPCTRRAAVPTDLERLSLKLLAKRPEDRFQSAEELVEAIEEVAASHKLVLSNGALGRFMKELFGQRPEPWVEMEVGDVVAGVTVSSEALLERSSTSDPMEAQLRQVRDLTRQLRDPASGSVPPPLSEGVPIAEHGVYPTVSLRPAHDSAGIPLPPPPGHTAAMLATMPMARDPGMPPQMPSGAFASAPAATLPHAESGSFAAAPGSVATVGPSAFAAAPISGSAMLAYPVVSSSPDLEPIGRGANVKVIAVIAALCVVASLAVWLTMRGGDDQAGTPPETTQAARGGAPMVASDAAVFDAVESFSAERPFDPPSDSGADPVADPFASAAAALAAGRYADGLAACGQLAITTEVGMLCTRLACKQGDAAAARVWIARAAKIERGVLEAECKRDGTDLRPKAVRPPGPTKIDPCKADPMSCQH